MPPHVTTPTTDDRACDDEAYYQGSELREQRFYQVTWVDDDDAAATAGGVRTRASRDQVARATHVTNQTKQPQHAVEQTEGSTCIQ